MDFSIIKLETKGDLTGSLIAVEGLKTIPFDIKRAYYIFDTKHGVRRGFHAHKVLQQACICLNGSVKFLLDDGLGSKEIVELNSPDTALYIGNGVWREMFDFSYGCVLLVLANKHYDENDYIRDYNEFIKYKKGVI